MADLGAVPGGSGRPYHLFTSVKEAWDYVHKLGGREEYGVRKLSVYGVYYRRKKKTTRRTK